MQLSGAGSETPRFTLRALPACRAVLSSLEVWTVALNSILLAASVHRVVPPGRVKGCRDRRAASGVNLVLVASLPCINSRWRSNGHFVGREGIVGGHGSMQTPNPRRPSQTGRDTCSAGPDELEHMHRHRHGHKH